MDKLQIDDKQYEIIGYDEQGVPTIRGIAESTQDGFDEDGNPKISVNITVPSITVGITPGKVE